VDVARGDLGREIRSTVEARVGLREASDTGDAAVRRSRTHCRREDQGGCWKEKGGRRGEQGAAMEGAAVDWDWEWEREGNSGHGKRNENRIFFINQW
jgi:hypothetical protein